MQYNGRPTPDAGTGVTHPPRTLIILQYVLWWLVALRNSILCGLSKANVYLK